MSIAASTLYPIFIKKSEQQTSINFKSDNTVNKNEGTFKIYFGTSSGNSKLYQHRLASYSRIINSSISHDISYVKLANAGFFLLDQELLVKCSGCGNTEKVCDLKSKISPSDEKYHEPGCSFVQVEGCSKEENDEANSVSDSQSLDSSSGATGNGCLPFCETASDTSFSSVGSVLVATGSDTGFSSLGSDLVARGSDTSFSSVGSVLVATGSDTSFSSVGSVLVATGRDTSFSSVGSVLVAIGNTLASLQNVKSSARLKPNNSDTDSAFYSSDDDTSQERYNPECVSASDVKQRDQSFENDMNGKTNPKSSLLREGKGKFNSEASGQSGIYIDVNAGFDDSEYFQPEYEVSNQEVQTCREGCKKNPGHYGFFPIWNLKLEYIPFKVRHPDVLRFFVLLAGITVRIVVGKTSKDRAKSYVVENGQKGRIGTGYAVSKPDNIPDAEQTGNHGKWRAVKEYCHIVRHKDHIYIRTNRHLVYDDTEAQSVMVEFFYDNPNRKGIVFAKGVSVFHSSVLGDLESILVCRTSDMSLVSMVSNSINEIETLAKNFSPNIKEEMKKKVFLIGHPHGGEKMFSCGEYVIVKFEIKQQNVNDHTASRIVKINNHTQISHNSDNIRKALLYTAEVCTGCTGSPVVSFTETGSGDAKKIELDMWMHMGLDTKNNLSASILKELTSDDIANHGHTIIYRPSIQDDMSAEADSAANQVVSSPVYKVAKPPAHPAYVAYIKRLQSYPTSLTHVHTFSDLADCGFFYAGYDDCVRCFHCGLGLKSWIAGDNIHEEHMKNKPDCEFLHLKLRESGVPALSLQSKYEPSAAVSPPVSLVSSEMEIMETEQRFLKQILICKVCLQKPVKDLFLPCAELVACADCSKLLTHCPSCNKQILATVTTYFS